MSDPWIALKVVSYYSHLFYLNLIAFHHSIQLFPIIRFPVINHLHILDSLLLVHIYYR